MQTPIKFYGGFQLYEQRCKEEKKKNKET